MPEEGSDAVCGRGHPKVKPQVQQVPGGGWDKVLGGDPLLHWVGATAVGAELLLPEVPWGQACCRLGSFPLLTRLNKTLSLAGE